MCVGECIVFTMAFRGVCGISLPKDPECGAEAAIISDKEFLARAVFTRRAVEAFNAHPDIDMALRGIHGGVINVTKYVIGGSGRGIGTRDVADKVGVDVGGMVWLIS